MKNKTINILIILFIILFILSTIILLRQIYFKNHVNINCSNNSTNNPVKNSSIIPSVTENYSEEFRNSFKIEYDEKDNINFDTHYGIYNSTIVAFGDSITYGTGMPEGSNHWTDIISERFNLNLINSGIPGNTSSQGLARIQEDVLNFNPDYVIINFGMNDNYLKEKNTPNVPLQTFKNNLEEMIIKIRSIDAIPILVAPNKIIEGNRGDGNTGGNASYRYKRHPAIFYDDVGGANAQLKIYCDTMRDIAVEKHVYFIDMYSESDKYDLYHFLRSLENDTNDDGVHPHKLGAQIYGKVIGDFLNKLQIRTSKNKKFLKLYIK